MLGELCNSELALFSVTDFGFKAKDSLLSEKADLRNSSNDDLDPSFFRLDIDVILASGIVAACVIPDRTFVSGEAPQEPVFSRTGYVFEKRLITKYLAEKGVCPITNEEMTEDDLSPIKSSTFISDVEPLVKPRAPTATSVPNALLSLQNEFDAVMLEAFELKKQFNEMQNQLSNALYENDAAKRVIARIIKERDEARARLQDFKASYGEGAVEQSQETQEMALEVDTLPQAVVGRIEANSEELSATRRKRKAPETLSTVEDISSLQESATIKTLNTAKESAVNTIDLQVKLEDGETREWLLTAGADGSASIVDKSSFKLVASAKAHKKPVHSAKWIGHTDTFLTASSDETVKCWSLESAKNGYKIKAAKSLNAHSGPVVDVAIHPTNDYFISAGEDAVWNFVDLERFEVISAVSTPEIDSGNLKLMAAYSTIQIHPDGLLLGTGSADSVVRLWDIKSKSVAASFTGHSGAISSISFSENGYHVATGSTKDSFVKFWDLRKLTDFHTLQLPNTDSFAGVPSVKFDHSGKYVGIAHGNNLSVYVVKKWELISTFEHHLSPVTDFAFGPDAKYIVTGSKERKVSILSA
ncbi:hypothetical protein HDV01_000220 [Terramyces sp. JEL0728]|nr:hypothetical protein HDV01_000220 [Terramyces sp. JEL0728]